MSAEPTEHRRQLHAYVSNDAYSGWADFALRHETNTSALLEAFGRVLERHTTRKKKALPRLLDDVVTEAHAVASQRSRRVPDLQHIPTGVDAECPVDVRADRALGPARRADEEGPDVAAHLAPDVERRRGATDRRGAQRHRRVDGVIRTALTGDEPGV